MEIKEWKLKHRTAANQTYIAEVRDFEVDDHGRQHELRLGYLVREELWSSDEVNARCAVALVFIPSRDDIS